MRIHFVIDTHVHADHLSAGRALADAAGDTYVLSAETGVSFPYKGVRDGEVLALGNVSATVLHTPGHTPEHICILVTDRTRADEPWFVLTGHTLMVGDLGRTEFAVSTEEGTKQLFRSVRKLKALPDYVEVMPGAYAGSVCGRRLSGNWLREAAQSAAHDRGRSRVCSVHGRRDSACAAGGREDQGRQFGPAGSGGLIP
jgi:glyoxylase-like metal-dependent hydrolase (beta-lactamase superfamily II)